MQERKNADRLIEQGVDALRAERAPSLNTQRIMRAMLGVKPKTQRRYVATAAASLALAAIAVVSFAPRESAAADLKAIERALQQLPPRQETHFVATNGGEYELQMQIVVDGEQAVLEEKDVATQTWRANRLTTVHDGYATVQDAPKPDWTSKTFVLRDWLRNAKQNTVVRSKVKASDIELLVGDTIELKAGLVLERVAFDVRIEPSRLAHIVFDVEPGTLRPLVVQAQIQGERERTIVFDYKVRDLSLLEFVTVPDTYDIDAQRNEILDGFTSPVATAEHLFGNVQLHAAIVDHQGNLVFVYSDTDGLSFVFDRSAVVDKEMQDSEAPAIDLMPTSLTDQVLKKHPVPYKDRKVGIVGLRLKKEWVDVKTIGRVTLPIERNGMDYSVTFLNVPVIKTGSVLQLLAPENVPFWIKKSEQGAPTKSGGE